MTKQLTVDEILEDYKSHAGWARVITSYPETTRDEAWLKQALKAHIEAIVREVMGSYDGGDLVLRDNQRRQEQRFQQVMEREYGNE